MNALVASPVVVWLVPVRGLGLHVHLVRRDERLGFDASSASLCGMVGPRDKFRRPKWRRVHSPGSGMCQACQAKACDAQRPGRIDWG